MNTNSKRLKIVNVNGEFRVFEENQVADIFLVIILSNKLLGDRIFKHLTRSECLATSLVSRKWNLYLREFLRRHHQCLLYCNLTDRKNLTSIAKFMETSMPNHPFNGIILDLSTRACHEFLRRIKFLKQWKEVRLEKWAVYWDLRKLFQSITIKSVIIRRFTTPEDIIDITGFYLSLLPFETIEHFQIEGSPVEWSFILKILKDRKFASLKTLQVPQFCYTSRQRHAICAGTKMGRVGQDPKKIEGLKEILEKCTALTDWKIPVNSYLVTEFNSAKKAFLVKNLVIVGSPRKKDVQCINAVEGLALTEMTVFAYRTDTETVRQIINKNIITLKTLHLNADLFKGLITEHQPVFTNLTHLTISFAGSVPNEQRLLERFMQTERVKLLFPQAQIVTKLATPYRVQGTARKTSEGKRILIRKATLKMLRDKTKQA